MRELTYKASFSGSIGLKDAPTKATTNAKSGFPFGLLTLLPFVAPLVLDFVFNDPNKAARKKEQEERRRKLADETRRIDFCEGWAFGHERPEVIDDFIFEMKDVKPAMFTLVAPEKWTLSEKRHDLRKKTGGTVADPEKKAPEFEEA